MIDRRMLMKRAGAAALASALDAPTARAEVDDPLSYASVDDLVAMFKAGKASPVDLLEAQIKRIEALNPKVNCITDAHFDEARKDARAVRGPLSARRGEAARRDHGRHQGRIRPAGLADHAGLAHLQGLAARDGKRSHHRLARGGRRRHAHPDDGAGILPLHRRLDPRLGHDPQSVEPRILPWRVVRGIRGGAGRGLRDARPGLGHGRLDPPSRLAERRLRLPAAIRAGRGRGNPLLDLGPDGATVRRPRPSPERDRRPVRQGHGRDPASPRLSLPIRRTFQGGASPWIGAPALPTSFRR